ncbi:cytochrome C oxidase copper chaperone-domain-containing protein [Rhypophila decipiens]|uniref:Cytochrome C oxidase copper chaperone-domain-containing protein n=1 Tax=Rhypophila decipiens TaxID=261697 RepID=A0AAN7BDH2_9PEZI|nr:cytochrome C oxidase copper chaperone-domain-containing protein [Rhypophila decipiens]
MITVSPAPAPVAPAASGDAASKPKPCCVCKDEKAKRDECMLFSKADDPEKDCKSTIELYKSCMAGYGFKV